ncbi:unnamed protein product [Psylliodes chrysocephalus]|uniref:Uncharacterized protein n=1 Tax=Psylliodes chrysocephalus TaxID=3402493 RepID=A0A9P0CRM4_9CUCU|nr:unnamed protein product [Psylliodes chrysocephala]
MYSQDSGYGSSSEFDFSLQPSSPTPSSGASEKYGRELDSLLEKYEEAAKNEVHYLLYTQFLQGSYQIGCGLSPARSFTPAVVIQKGQSEKISFSSYEWEQLITLLQDNNFFNEIVDLPDEYDGIEFQCGDYCKVRQVIFEDTKFIIVSKHNIDFWLTEQDVMELVDLNRQLLTSYVLMLETVQFPQYYYKILNIIRSSFNDKNYTFSGAFHKMHVFKNLDSNLKNVALGQFIYFYKQKIVNDFERI